MGIMATKQTNPYSDGDGNWHWPEKTWFRERLNALKAQEQEVQQRRKPLVKSGKPTVGVQPEPSVAESTKVD